MYVCLFVFRTFKWKWLELSAPNLVHIYSIGQRSKGQRSRSHGYEKRHDRPKRPAVSTPQSYGRWRESGMALESHGSTVQGAGVASADSDSDNLRRRRLYTFGLDTLESRHTELTESFFTRIVLPESSHLHYLTNATCQWHADCVTQGLSNRWLPGLLNTATFSSHIPYMNLFNFPRV